MPFRATTILLPRDALNRNPTIGHDRRQELTRKYAVELAQLRP